VRRLACGTVVVTGDWVPDHELARRGGLAMDPGTAVPWSTTLDPPPRRLADRVDPAGGPLEVGLA
jgi:hypothetical protein